MLDSGSCQAEESDNFTLPYIESDIVDAEVRYDLDGRTWDQPFVTRILDQAALEARLGDAWLRFDRWLDEPRGWFVARPDR